MNDIAGQNVMEFPPAYPLSHRDDPGTSYAAADRLINSGELNRQEQEVYEVMKRHNRPAGYTAKELAYIMTGDYTKNYFKVQRRLSGLRHKGKAGRVKIDGTITFAESPDRKDLIERNNCCVWRAK